MIYFRILLSLFLLPLLCFCSGPDSENNIKISRINQMLHNVYQNEHKPESKKDDWKLRYFPYEPGTKSDMHPMFADSDDKFSVDPNCDDGKSNLTIDWDESDEVYSCSQETLNVNATIRAVLHSDFIPTAYVAPHFCMEYEISYPNLIPTFGGYRPLWGRFGEYKFIPKQRWLHNAEHGGIIMLYHPCADPVQVDFLRKLVTSCIYRHIITPYNYLPKERPLALLTWGSYLNMNVVLSKLVVKFIKEHALRGPENVQSNGKYDYLLIKPAQVVSDDSDSILCPRFILEE